jgi:hypothetical protein
MNYQDYVTAQQMQMQVPQYQAPQMMPMQQMQPMVTMAPRSAEEEEYRRQQMMMSGLDPDVMGDRMRYAGQNVMSMPARIMEAPSTIGKKAKKQAKGLLDLFK